MMGKTKRTKNKVKEEKTMEDNKEVLENETVEEPTETNDEVNEEVNNEETTVEEPTETNDEVNEEMEEFKTGVIDNCFKLYIRKNPDKESEPLGILENGTELAVDLTHSTDEFYKVTTFNGIEGYCIKDYVKIK